MMNTFIIAGAQPEIFQSRESFVKVSCELKDEHNQGLFSQNQAIFFYFRKRVGVVYPPHIGDKDKSILLYSKKMFLFSSVWPGTEYPWALIWKKSLVICFGSYQGTPYTHTGRVDRLTLLMVNINTICRK